MKMGADMSPSGAHFFMLLSDSVRPKIIFLCY